MSKEHNSRLWVCTRCARKKGIELEADPVLLKVCDECKIQNWCRNPKGAGLVITEVLKEAEPEPEPVFEASKESMQSEIDALRKQEKELLEVEEAKQTEIEALKAQLAELET